MKTVFRSILGLISVHWLTSVGAVLTTASAIVFLMLIFQHFNNPYVGIVVFLVIPAIFVFGLILMPVGFSLAARHAGGTRQVWEQLTAKGPGLDRLAWIFIAATAVNVGILMLAAYHSVGVMDSSQFCGVTCHSVMQPQYVRYQKSAHARIPCVDCHVGSGAASFVQYKLAGARQLYRLVRGNYSRPIPPAMDHLRPASEICEQCHFQQRPHEDRLKVIRHYTDDEHTTEKVTVLLLKIDSAIHKAHVGRDIEYEGDRPDPQVITSVQVDGKTYTREGASPGTTRRKMDCMDCHNRVGHDFDTAEAAVDAALTQGRLDRSRPWVRRDAISTLKAPSGAGSQPALQMIRSENEFPQMNIQWGTYPNNIGHDPFPGCFRCHDGEHVTKTGDSITQDCASCHELLAVEEQDPKILKDLGIQ